MSSNQQLQGHNGPAMEGITQGVSKQQVRGIFVRYFWHGEEGDGPPSEVSLVKVVCLLDDAT
jgi:hypothetical protein